MTRECTIISTSGLLMKFQFHVVLHGALIKFPIVQCARLHHIWQGHQAGAPCICPDVGAADYEGVLHALRVACRVVADYEAAKWQAFRAVMPAVELTL